MSAKLFYHLFGMRDFRELSSVVDDGDVVIRVELPRAKWRCSCCKSTAVIARGAAEHRQWRTVPLGSKPIFIRWDVPRVECKACGQVRQLNVPFAEPKKQYTRALARHVVELLPKMTIQDVATQMSLSWDTVKTIQKTHLQRHFANPKLKHVELLAIDELCIGSGHRYVTVVLDLETGAALFVGEGKGQAALLPFWKKLRASRAKIKAVATDLSAAYRAAVRKNLPKAKHVADPFHIVKLMNQKLSALRRSLYGQLDALGKKVLKGTRWLLLKNPEHLDEGKDELQRLEEALTLNKPLATAYYLKEDLRQIWSYPDRATTRRALNDWIRRARASGIAQLRTMAKTLAESTASILNHCTYEISTGPLETFNNKIQRLQRQVYGFRDKEFFYLKILALHKAKYALLG